MISRIALIGAVTIAVLAQLATSWLASPALLRWNATQLHVVPKLLLWNTTASAPRGLYLLRAARPLHTGELVVVLPPPALAEYLASRGYVPFGVPLLKHVAALQGQIVCRIANRITIDGHVAALTRERDTRGRTLPFWQGCRTLRAGQVFLLNSTIPDSFDGRYFGVLPATAIAARAEPFWILSEP